MYKTSVKSNVDGITHTITHKIIKMLDKVQTELDHSENATHSLWFTKLTKAFQPNYSGSATHPDPTHVMLMVIKNKMVLCTLINSNLHETGLLLIKNCKKLSKLQIIIKPVVMKNGSNSREF